MISTIILELSITDSVRSPVLVADFPFVVTRFCRLSAVRQDRSVNSVNKRHDHDK
jgi:hypothetical protein